MHRLLLIFFCFSVVVNTFSFKQERIIDFHSGLLIETDGKITVTENIKVYANGENIKRGIVRSLPVSRTDIHGKKQKVSYKICAVQRNGIDEKYHVKAAGDYRDIYIGKKGRILDPGIHTYTIVYETYGQIGFFDDYDEIYWNVTGNDWRFDIEQASATIILPKGATSISNACYTGRYGSTASNCLSEIINENKIYFTTNTDLWIGHGFTVATSFPRDIIRRGSPASKKALFWLKYRHIILISFGMVIMFLYGFLTWRKVGKDPEKPVVIPQFNPPNNRSPSVVRYLYKRKYDDKTFTALLVNMAVKGAIRINQEGENYSLTVVNRNVALSDDERIVFVRLFSKSDTLEITEKNDLTFSKAYNSLTKELEYTVNFKDYLVKNIKYIVYAALIVIGVIAINGIVLGYSKSIVGLLFNAVITVSGIYGLYYVFLLLNNMGKIVMSFFISFFLIPGIIFFISILFKTDTLFIIFIAVTITLFVLYVYLIKAPTQLGSKTQSELEGFRMYLKTAEENRLNLLTPPKHTPELFEQLLPYAIALDVENEWSKKFEKELKSTGYQPEWYDGDKSFSAYSFTGVFGDSFSSAVAKVNVGLADSSSGSGSGSSGSSSWSSGSSGGGFSGGGGGGGGGRGW